MATAEQKVVLLHQGFESFELMVCEGSGELLRLRQRCLMRFLWHDFAEPVLLHRVEPPDFPDSILDLFWRWISIWQSCHVTPLPEICPGSAPGTP